MRPFKNSSQERRKPGLQGVSGTPQQPNGGNDSAVIPETDFAACTYPYSFWAVGEL
jgi:hypothetical protein